MDLVGAGNLGPAGAGRVLRAGLRRAREAVGRTQVEVAEQLGWSPSKMARIESGEVGVTPDDLRALCSALELGPAVAEELVRQARAARRRGWWHEYRSEIEPGYFKLLGLEAESEAIDELSLAAVPGLLQTRRYAEAVQQAAVPSMEPERVAVRVEVRMRRQREVFEIGDAPVTRVLLDESVLYRRTSSTAVMAEQLDRLAELARRPYLTLRIVPFESRIIWNESFLVLRNSVAGTTVYNESRLGDVLIDAPRAVGQFERQFALMWEAALDVERTGQLLHRAAAGYGSGEDPRPWLWA